MSQEQPDGPTKEFSAEEVERILNRLPPLSRAVLELRCGEKRSYEEIAEELDLPVSCVRKYMKGALVQAYLIVRGLGDERAGRVDDQHR